MSDKTQSNFMSRLVGTIIQAKDAMYNGLVGMGTGRDKREYTSYKMPYTLDQFTAESMYRTSWLAKRIVNIIADDMTREWRDVSFDSKGDDTSFADAIVQGEQDLQIEARFNKALRWARLFGGSLIVMGMADGRPDLPLDPTTVKKGDLKFLHVIDRWRISPGGNLTDNDNITTDITSYNFGMPEYYILADGQARVHHTRVIRFDGEILPYNSWTRNARWHDSVLQHTLDSLKNIDTTSQAIATMMFEANIPTVKMKGYAEAMASEVGEQVMATRYQSMAMMASFNRVRVIDSEDEIGNSQINFAGMAEIWQKFMVDVCGACDIPMTKLFGQSISGLGVKGDNEITQYYDMIKGKQKTEATPQLRQLDEVFVRSTLGTMPDDFQSEWSSLWQISDVEQAVMILNQAQADQIYLATGVVTPGLVAQELKTRGTYSNMTDEDVEMATELSELDEEDTTNGNPNPNDDPQNPQTDPKDPGSEGRQASGAKQ